MFIYVMDTKSKKKLLKLGYTLLKDNGNKKNPVWIFKDNEDYSFEMLSIPCITSDILTF